MSTTRLKIAKLAGATDREHIEKALESVPRVSAVAILSDRNDGVIGHDGADERELVTAVKQQGYGATLEPPE